MNDGEADELRSQRLELVAPQTVRPRKSEKSLARRHMIIPDTQLRPGVPSEHIDWAAQAIVDYRPDVIAVIGDWWDMPSLSKHELAGSIHTEGNRIRADIDVGNEAFERLVKPLHAEQNRLASGKRKLYTPQKHFFFGNHENRITRAIGEQPKFADVLSLDDLNTQGFQRHPFLEIVEIDGIAYSHYFSNTHSGRAIGGSVDNRLNKIGKSFIQGHEQGLLYGIKQFPGELVRHGLVAGSFYLHDEHYRDAQSNGEWRGIVVLNQVDNGQYDVMPLSMKYLRSRYG